MIERNRRIALVPAACGMLLGLFAGTARSQPVGTPAADASSTTDEDSTRELGEALRQFYVRALSDELGLSPERAMALAPKVRALLDAQRTATRDAVAAGLAIRRAAGGAGNAAAAIASFENEEIEGRERIAAARGAVFEDLTPRQKARFLAFEGRFRERVRALAQGRDPVPAASARQATGPREPLDPEAAPARQENPEFLRTRLLLFVHEVRTELALDDARTLTLVPPIEHLVEARIAGERERRRLHARLREQAWSDGATDTELAALVAECLAAERAAADSRISARKTLLALLSPAEGARFLVLEQRVLGQARRGEGDVRGLRRNRAGGDGQDAFRGRPAGPRRPNMQGPAER